MSRWLVRRGGDLARNDFLPYLFGSRCGPPGSRCIFFRVLVSSLLRHGHCSRLGTLFCKTIPGGVCCDSSAGVESRPGRCCDWDPTSPGSPRDPREALGHTSGQAACSLKWIALCSRTVAARGVAHVVAIATQQPNSSYFCLGRYGVKRAGKAFDY